MSTGSRSHCRRIAIVVVLVLYCTILSFSLSDGFFWADDTQCLSFINSLSSIRAAFGFDAFGLFRPVKNFLWIGIARLAPYGIEWCHLLAILVGMASFFPIQALFRRILGSEWKALAAATLWILAPTLVSSVAWLSCLNIQIMAAFSALAIVNHDAAWDAERYRPFRTAIASLFLFLALISYECAVAVVPLLVFFDLLLRKYRIRNPETWKSHALYFSILVLYLVLRALSESRMTMIGSWADANRWQLILSSPLFAVQHFSTWFWPFGNYTVLGGYRWGDVSPWMLGACWGVMLAILVLLVVLWKRWPVLAFCILFTAIGFAPTSNCLGFGNGPYGDYYITLSSIGIAAGCVEAMWHLALVRGFLRSAALIVVLVFILSRIATIFEASRWAHLWSDGSLAFAESVRNHPQFVSNKISYVQFLTDEGRYEEALELVQQIEELTPPDSNRMAIVHLVRALYAINVIKDPDSAFKALDLCQQARSPGIPDSMVDYYRGCVFEDLLEDMDQARRQYEHALSSGLEVGLAPCANRLARIMAIQGETSEAIVLWERTIDILPGDVSVLWNLAVAYRDTGNIKQAEQMLEKVKIVTNNPNLKRPASKSNHAEHIEDR